MKNMLRLLAAACIAALSLFTPHATPAQDGAKPGGDSAKAAPGAPAPVKVDERALAVVARAAEALGGQAYLGVRTAVSRGYFTPFREGTPGIPVTFRDYMAYPDRERTEFKGADVKTVQVNTGETGWVFEGKAKKLTDVTPEQAADFRTALRTSVDNIVRGWWRAEGAALAYAGRREAGLARRNEVVRLSYPDGFVAEFEFDAREGLPSKVVYRRPGAEGETVEEEDRYAQFQQVGGVRVPFIIDHYRAGVQSSRVNYEEIEFNRPVPDALFARPADPKSVKF